MAAAPAADAGGDDYEDEELAEGDDYDDDAAAEARWAVFVASVC